MFCFIGNMSIRNMRLKIRQKLRTIYEALAGRISSNKVNKVFLQDNSSTFMTLKKALVAFIAKVNGVVFKNFFRAALPNPFLFRLVDNEGSGHNSLTLCIAAFHTLLFNDF